MMMRSQALNRSQQTLRQKLWSVHWFLVVLLGTTASIGFAMLYSAAGGHLDPWASRQIARFGIGVAMLIAVAVTDIRVWIRYAYLLYLVSLALLTAVEFFGIVGMGAQRWIDLGVINLQPSELMKIALVLALARYFHGLNVEDVGRPLYLIPPLFLVAVPTALVLRQPDLGTALMLLMIGGIVFFAAGVRVWKFVAVIAAGLAAMPVAWQFLRDYQKQRVLTFLSPESDPLGAGYHIIQSKIALGSGGVFGKGFMQGSQSHLSFLPEKQTDFIFATLAEEFGFVGCVSILILYAAVIFMALRTAYISHSHFGRLAAAGLTATFTLYVLINGAMVMGLAPVVGVPMPLLSYGGTVMLTVMIGFGLVMSVRVHRYSEITSGKGSLL